MSTALAIASVTHVLKDLLNNGLIDQNVSGATGGNVNVTALPPDRIDVSAAGQSQLNLFMYRVSTNTGWSNIGFPSHNPKGERTGNPPLALNLHYLLTAYGSSELHSEILLGYGMQILHEAPVLSRQAIQLSLSPATAASSGGLPDELKALSTSNLASQAEQIKITPETINTEEISKLWAAFQARYRPSAAYLVSVVLIESELATKPPLPVDSRNLNAFSYQAVNIDNILSRIDANSPKQTNQKILTGFQVIVQGSNLYSPNLELTLNGKALVNIDSAIENEIIFTLPDTVLAGIQSVQIIHKTEVGDPPKLIRTSESNTEQFVLCPKILTATVTNLQGNGSAPRSADVNLTVVPGIDPDQKIELILNEYKPGAEAGQLSAYRFKVAKLPPTSPPGLHTNLKIPVKNIKAGKYIVRLRVDGAESPLGARDINGYFFEPNITIN